MTTQSGEGGKKAASPKRRKRDSHVKTAPAKRAADTFVDAFVSDTGKGAATRSAQAAYPNQSKISASQTANELLKDPYVIQQIKIRQQTCRTAAVVTREDLIGCLMFIIYGSLDDVIGINGEIDWETARFRGIAHLIQEVDRTERHSKDGSSRVTTKYKLPNKLQAMDLLTEMTGWKKQPAKNPTDAARETYLIMRQNESYKDITDEELAKFPAQRFNVSVAEILEGAV